METTRSEQLFKKAVDLIPGGVNSPVRAFGNVGMTPRFIASANGVYLTDADGNKYLDYVGSWGPMILGHTREDVLEKVFEACKKGLSFGAATEAEVEMAELICSMVPFHAAKISDTAAIPVQIQAIAICIPPPAHVYDRENT